MGRGEKMKKLNKSKSLSILYCYRMIVLYDSKERVHFAKVAIGGCTILFDVPTFQHTHNHPHTRKLTINSIIQQPSDHISEAATRFWPSITSGAIKNGLFRIITRKTDTAKTRLITAIHVTFHHQQQICSFQSETIQNRST
jgi:hypothetical protein